MKHSIASTRKPKPAAAKSSKPKRSAKPGAKGNTPREVRDTLAERAARLIIALLMIYHAYFPPAFVRKQLGVAAVTG